MAGDAFPLKSIRVILVGSTYAGAGKKLKRIIHRRSMNMEEKIFIYGRKKLESEEKARRD